MNWEEACQDPSLQDLPYHIELDKEGSIVMSPVGLRHSYLVNRILRILFKLFESGECLVEMAIETSAGVKVPDAVWISDNRFDLIKDQKVSQMAPEICIEVLSPGQTLKAMIQKSQHYYNAGAEEVWICDQEGNMCFTNNKGLLDQSDLMPEFPKTIGIDLS